MQAQNSILIDKSVCPICNKKFNNMFVTEHQCKRCLRAICKECCSKKKLIFTSNLNNHINTKTGYLKAEEHRTCNLCLPVSQKIAKLIKINGVVFNQSSKLGTQWIDLLEMNKSVIQRHNSIQKHHVQINKAMILTDLWAKCSPSFRELLGFALVKTNSAEVKQIVGSILDKINSKQNQSLLTTYILCFCQESHALKLVKCLSQIKSNFSIDNVHQYLNLQIQNDKQFADKNEIKNLLNFSSKFSQNILFVSDLFLPLLPIQTVNEIIHEALLSSSPTIMQLIASFVLYHFREIILNSKVTDQDIRMCIRYRLNSEIIDKGIKGIRSLIIKKNKKSDNNPFNINFLSPEKIEKTEEEQLKDEDDIMKKINQASQYLRKIQQNQITDEQIDATQMENLDKYLDLLIAQNDKSLNEIDNFDKMLSSIEEKLYKINNQN